MLSKLEDVSEFSPYFSDSHLEELAVYWHGRQHRIELMLQADQKYYYSLRDTELGHHSAYICHQHSETSSLYIVMPFLIVRNHTHLNLSLTITEKKSLA
jgi:hypothetical protein